MKFLVLPLILIMAGCASVTRGTTEQVQFTSSPVGALVETSIDLSCTTPCVLLVPRNQRFLATFSLEGKEPATIAVETEVVGAGVAGVAGNAILGGLIGVGVDTATGAAMDHKPNPVHVDFENPPPPLALSKKQRDRYALNSRQIKPVRVDRGPNS